MFQQIPGPVLAVGHSYGGAVITNAASQVDNVVGLVYVAAFVPDEGETLAGTVGTSPESALMSAVPVFAADLPQQQSDVLAVSQRPAAAATLSEMTGPPAWKKLRSWAVVGTADKAMGSDMARSMAQRAGANTTEIDGSHVVMLSQPDAVTEVILKAHQAVM